MATEVTKIVDPDNGTGTDYTSLDAWEDDLGGTTSGDLVTDDEIAIARCRSSSGTADTTQVRIFGWASWSGNDIRIEGADFPADGIWDDSAYVFQQIQNTHGIRLDEYYCRITNIQFYNARTGTSAAENKTVFEIFGNYTTIDSCIFRGNVGAAAQGYGLLLYGNGNTSLVSNCIFYGFNGGTGHYGLSVDRSSGTVIVNCTVYDCTTGIDTDANTTVLNCIVGNCTDDISGTPNSVDYCASDDGDGTNSISPSGSDWGNEMTDPANGDFTILNTGNCYEGSAVTQDDDANVPSDDIIGTARNTATGTSTSVGAFEYVSAGGPSIPIMRHHYSKNLRTG